MSWIELMLMLSGFAIASYAIVGNDAIQTLGTFLSSNAKRPWWVLWAFSSTIMAGILVYGWAVNGGDPAFGRLEKFPLPDPFTWLYLVPPIVLLILTRLGIPVSTTFLVLTVFQVSNLPKMLMTSLLGYAVAFAAAIVLYLVIARFAEKRFIDTRDKPPSTVWVALQWMSTAYLWGMWLVQDLANVFVYLPRKLSLGQLAGALAVMLAIQAYIFYSRGGAVQKIVNSKTNTQDIRSAAVINFLYGTILLLFKDGLINWIFFGVAEKIPMSTTWVFLGLLAGRELAMNVHFNMRSWRDLGGAVGADAFKAGVGLAASIVIAVSLPYAAAMLPEMGIDATPAAVAPDTLDPTDAHDAAAPGDREQEPSSSGVHAPDRAGTERRSSQDPQASSLRRSGYPPAVTLR